MTTALALLPDFALILLGLALRRVMHLGDHFWTGLEKLVYFVLFPALLFNALVRTTIDWQAAPCKLPALKFLGRLSEASIALGLLTVGAALKVRGAFGSGGRAAAAWLMAVKLLVMPAAALFVARALGMTGLYFDIAVAFAALPTASSAYILTQRMGGDGARVAWLISATTLAAMLTLPAWLAAL